MQTTPYTSLRELAAQEADRRIARRKAIIEARRKAQQPPAKACPNCREPMQPNRKAWYCPACKLGTLTVGGTA